MKGATVNGYVVGIELSYISIHAPNEGSDTTKKSTAFKALLFQSTLPMKGATGLYFTDRQSAAFQSTLPMKGATLTLSALNKP